MCHNNERTVTMVNDSGESFKMALVRRMAAAAAGEVDPTVTCPAATSARPCHTYDALSSYYFSIQTKTPGVYEDIIS